MTDDEKKTLNRKAIVGAALIPIAVPNSVISVSNLFNAAALSTSHIALWSFSAVLSLAVVAVAGMFIYRSLAAERYSCATPSRNKLPNPRALSLGPTSN